MAPRVSKAAADAADNPKSGRISVGIKSHPIDRQFPDSPYRTTRKVGEGSFGKVYRGRDRHNGELVALKIIDVDSGEETPAETTLLKELEHENIVKFIDCEKHICLAKQRVVMEYISCDLDRFMRNKNLKEHSVKFLMYQLLKGIDFCHREKKVLHRDLKPGNILVNRRGELKIADFGLAIHFTDSAEALDTNVATRWYRAPDVILGNATYGTSLDIWSAGCIMAEISSGKPLFPGTTEDAQLDCIFRIMGTPTEKTWPGLEKLPMYEQSKPTWNNHNAQNLGSLLPNLGSAGIDLLQSMLQLCPEKRITAAKALEHPWLKDADKGHQRQKKGNGRTTPTPTPIQLVVTT